MTISDQVYVLAHDLASRWNGGEQILDRLVRAAGGGELSPLAAYRRLGAESVDHLFSQGAARAELDVAVQRLLRYRSQETWFDRAARAGMPLESLPQRPVAYFCAEFGLEDWLPIYAGGLGILAGDVLKEASDLGLPLVGMGLFYHHGFFRQQLDDTGWQTEVYPELDPEELGLSRARLDSGDTVVVDVPIENRTVYAAVWRVQVGRTILYLLDTNIAENERPEDRAITAKLYGGDEETRIQQELVLGIGGVRALRLLGIQPSVYSMNEGHAAFLGVELLAEALSETDFDEALRRIRSRVVYTNHTVVPAGNDIFRSDQIGRYLGPYASQCGVGVARLLEMASSGDEDHFSMAILAFRLSGKANGVSRIHAEVVAREWPGRQVESVTNGVHVPTWVGAEVQELLDRYVPDWRSDSPSWDRVEAITTSDLWRARVRQRRRMLNFLAGRMPGLRLDENALTIVWARRFAEYKRAGLIARDLERLTSILSDSKRPVQLVFSGKAHPKDEVGKRILQELLSRLHTEPSLNSKVAFMPDYRIAVARELAGGADVWMNTPRKPLEASGTSGMKSGDNGGIQLTVRDGWAAEVDWWDIGWGIEGRDDQTDAKQLYQFLEESVVPTFYARDEAGLPQKWTSMMRKSMAITLSGYSARRMLLDYVHKLYLPSLQEQQALRGVSEVRNR
jgi:starch phosphorylase